MARVDVILTVGVIAVRSGHSTRDVARFARYVQYRDVHPDSDKVRDVDGLVRYAQFRDASAPHGRLFNADGRALDDDRNALVDYVRSSLPESGPDRSRVSTTSERAVYRMIISPADARGLDLQKLTRATMSQLQQDIGAPLPRWIAAEHRNTLHPHVHVILPARRVVRPGRFRTVVITRDRLANMKLALNNELVAQRKARDDLGRAALHPGEMYGRYLERTGAARTPPVQRRASLTETPVMRTLAWSPNGQGHLPVRFRADPSFRVAAMAGRLARCHQREAERLARKRLHDDHEEESGRERTGRR